jgi:lipoprotein-releasing system permease protein
MYKLLLCWRYLRTRYIALASVISVTLGVATMIVVNSVMSGFTTEMRDRIHGILSDVVLEHRSLNGFPDPEWHMEQIRRVAGDSIAGMTPTARVPALLSFRLGDEWITQAVQLIGIDAATQSQVSDFSKYLQHPGNRKQMSFRLREGGYDVRDHQAGPDSPERPDMAIAGWEYRRRLAGVRAMRERLARSEEQSQAAPSSFSPESGEEDAGSGAMIDPFAAAGQRESDEVDMATDQHTGVVLGMALAMKRIATGKNHYEDRFVLLPGDDVVLGFPDANPTKPEGSWDRFTVVDFYESKMSEYDASFVFVPIEKLQDLRGMVDPATGVRFVNTIQMKLKPGVEGAQVRDRLRAAFSPDLYLVSTWQDVQGPLLAAVQMETAILNVLLFLIITVAGFGILAIFLMIVVEKTRDIGILKSLGASGWGIQGIFLSYGLSLGLVGSGAGMVLGLLFVKHINQIADGLGWLTGRPVFDPEIYYFYRIPAIVDAWTVGWIVFGAVAIAVLASILPAFRAARLHPVEALRYE